MKIRLQQLITKQSTLLDMLNEGDLTKDEWRDQNDLIRKEQHPLNNRKVELLLLLKNEKNTDATTRAFEKQISNLINVKFDDVKLLKLTIHKLIDKIEVFEDQTIKIHFNFKNPSTIKGA